MNNYLVRSAFVIMIALGAASAAAADIKVKTKSTVDGRASEGAVYIKGPRQRSSQGDGAFSFVTIYQCDLKRTVQLNDQAKKYLIIGMAGEQPGGATNKPQPGASQPTTRRGGVVTYTTTSTDTGERKKFFGYTARRIKSTMTADSSPDACHPTQMRMETDGWYIDLEYDLDCWTDRPLKPLIPSFTGPECQDEIRQKTSGVAKLGYPVLATTIMYGPDGRATTTTTEVVELTAATLDAALFDVPADYTEAKDFQELIGVPAAPGVPSQAAMTGQPQADAPAGAAQAKQPGATRVGVVAINNKTSRNVSTAALRGTLIGGISGANVEAVPLDATAPPAIEAEAKQKGCDYILYTDIAELKKSGSKVGGLLGRATGVGVANERYEARLDSRLFPTGSASPQLASSSAAKEEGAEDVSLNAAAGREAQAVVAELQKKK